MGGSVTAHFRTGCKASLFIVKPAIHAVTCTKIVEKSMAVMWLWKGERFRIYIKIFLGLTTLRRSDRSRSRSRPSNSSRRRTVIDLSALAKNAKNAHEGSWPPLRNSVFISGTCIHQGFGKMIFLKAALKFENCLMTLRYQCCDAWFLFC